MPRATQPPQTRQDEILDAAQALFMERGYAKVTVQAIIDQVGIAKGTFYHHYRSKNQLLDALVGRMLEESLELVLPIVEDPQLSALDKFKGLFARVGAWKVARRDLMLQLLQAMNAPENLGLRVGLLTRSYQVMEPILARVIQQGNDEGVFHTRHPAQAARMVMRLGNSLSEGLGDVLLEEPSGPRIPADVQELVQAHHEAIERVLQAPPGSLELVDQASLEGWFSE